MSEIFKFKEFAGSGRGLTCRPTIPTDTLATSTNISAISYRVKNMTDSGAWSAPVSLVVADVMFDTPIPWSKQTGRGSGYTFRFAAPGTLWPDPEKTYRIEITFTPKDGDGDPDPSLAFMEVWEVETLSTG